MQAGGTTLNVGPHRRWGRLALTTTAVVAALVGATTFVALSNPRPSVGRLGYGTTGIGSGGGGGFFDVGRTYAVATPPLYDAGRAPLVLQRISVLTTGCSAPVVRTDLFRSNQMGDEEALGTTWRSGFRHFGYRGYVGPLKGIVLRHATQDTRSYVEVFTLSTPTSGAFALLGFKVQFTSGGSQVTQYLGSPLTFLPIVPGHAATHAPWGTIDNLDEHVGVAMDGDSRGFPCAAMAPYSGS
jgi:hypothetical protein